LGFKRRMANTRDSHNHVNREVLDRFAVLQPATYPDILAEREIAEIKRREDREKRRKKIIDTVGSIRMRAVA
jgi:hypothetical protein